MQEITRHVDIFFQEYIPPEDEEATQVLAGEQVPLVMNTAISLVSDAQELTEDSVKALLKAVGKQTGLKGKMVFMPLRVALTGRTHGPELHQVIPILGKERTVSRLKKAIK